MLQQNDWDTLAHVLRKLCVYGSCEERLQASELLIHLVLKAGEGGDYARLLHFLEFYGRKFTWGSILGVLRTVAPEGGVVVELGSGSGWLSREIMELGYTAITVDKRHYPSVMHVLDMEEKSDRAQLLAEIPTNAVIMSNDFLHCVTDPLSIIRSFRDHDQIHAEYNPPPWAISTYHAQLKKYGAEPYSMHGLYKSIRSPRTLITASSCLILVVRKERV